MLAALFLPMILADYHVDGHASTGNIPSSTFTPAVAMITEAMPSLGQSIQQASNTIDVHFGRLPPKSRDANGNLLAGTADTNTVLVDPTLDLEETAATLVHEYMHVMSLSGQMGLDVAGWPLPCLEALAYAQELIYLEQRSLIVWEASGFPDSTANAPFDCSLYNHSRSKYETEMANCTIELPSWFILPAPTCSWCRP